MERRIRSGFVGTLLMDLSKPYDCLPNDILVPNFEAYCIDKNELNLVWNYLLKRKQRKNAVSSDTGWYIKVRGVSQYIKMV